LVLSEIPPAEDSDPNSASGDSWVPAKDVACGSPKFCPPLKSTTWIIAIHRPGALIPAHDSRPWTNSGCDFSPLPQSPELLARKSGSSAATRGSETQAT